MRSIELALVATALVIPLPFAQPQTLRDTERVASVLVQRMQLERGERVLLAALPGRSDALIPVLRRMIREAGAIDLGVIAGIGEPDSSWVTEFTRSAPRDRAGLATYLATVEGYVRWNFFTDATVRIGDEVWVNGGKLVKRVSR